MDAIAERTALDLSADEALVLFEAASKLVESDAVEGVLDAPEMQRLHDLVVDLERQVPEVLAPDYAARLAQAKARLSA